MLKRAVLAVLMLIVMSFMLYWRLGLEANRLPSPSLAGLWHEIANPQSTLLSDALREDLKWCIMLYAGLLVWAVYYIIDPWRMHGRK